MERPESEEANVISMIGDWREEAIDLETLLHSNSGRHKTDNNSLGHSVPNHNSISQQINHLQEQAMLSNNSGLPPYTMKQGVPTFSSGGNRPSVLDLSTTIKFQDRHSPGTLAINGHAQQQQQRSVSPHQNMHSPHHSPYMQNTAQQVFTYNNMAEQHSPVSPHRRIIHSPVSPHSQHEQGPLSPHMPLSPHHMVNQQQPVSPHSPYAMANRGPVSPVSPHHGMMSPHSPGPVSPHHMSNHPGGMSPHHPGMHSAAPMSPHHVSSHSGSVSPMPQQHSPAPGASQVFGRYAESPHSMHSGTESDADCYYTAAQIAEMRKQGIHIDKHSDMYRAKRERNNVAVRKSREKKKQREQETEKKVKELSDENSALQNKLDLALKEMNLLKNLYKSIGVQLPPDVKAKLENELSKFK